MAKTKSQPSKLAAQESFKPNMDAARERARAKQQQRQYARPTSDHLDKKYTLAVTEHAAERDRAEQRSVRRVLLSADDLWAMGIRYSRTQLWKLTKQGRFPKPVKISDSRSAYVASEVEAWLEERKNERAA
jgi:prophage regulatory protein